LRGNGRGAGLGGPSVPLGTVRAFAAGLRAASRSLFIFVTIGTFLGIGALAHDVGFSLAWAVVTTVVLWAGPAQVILISTLGAGAPLIEVAIAVSLSAVRLLPMVVSLIPMLRAPGTKRRHLLLPAHFIAVVMWVEGMRVLPGVARADRIAFINGFGAMFTTVGAIFTAVGYVLAGALPFALTAGLLLLTPLAFLLSLAGNLRTIADRLALALGLVFSPALAAMQVQLDLVWGGLAAGTIAYLAQRLRRSTA
jgi:predicted branched-subunit amino acid permease